MSILQGMNVLNLALGAIGRQSFDYYRFKSRTQNANKQYTVQYEAPITLAGSIQPVPRRLYAQYGLQLDKNYYTVFVSQNIIDVKRGVSGDQFFFCKKVYQCESITNWYKADGWTEVLCIQTPDVQP